MLRLSCTYYIFVPIRTVVAFWFILTFCLNMYYNSFSYQLGHGKGLHSPSQFPSSHFFQPSRTGEEGGRKENRDKRTECQSQTKCRPWPPLETDTQQHLGLSSLSLCKCPINAAKALG